MFLALTLLTPAWRVGIFTWLPILRLPAVGGRQAVLGLLSVLPVAIVLCWVAWRLLGRGNPLWRWGRRGLAVPLAGLSLLVLLSLDPALTWRTDVQVVALALCWLVYLFVVNEAPSLTPPLAVIVAVQSLVAIGQFLLQRNLGLAALGEPTLSPVIEGTSVLVANGQPWLRAYGLTGHPNALGALLAVLLLILLPAVLRAGGWRRWALLITLLLGLTGLLFSFSRNAWLAFGGGLLALAIAARASRQAEAPTPQGQRTQLVTLAAVGVTAVAVLLLLGTYRDLIASRLFHPDIPVEATSLNERQRDAAIAVAVIGQHPWRGVGAGNYPAAGRELDPAARTVHNVPLLVAAELGLPGLLLLIWLGLAPFVRLTGRKGGVPWYRRLSTPVDPHHGCRAVGRSAVAGPVRRVDLADQQLAGSRVARSVGRFAKPQRGRSAMTAGRSSLARAAPPQTTRERLAGWLDQAAFVALALLALGFAFEWIRPVVVLRGGLALTSVELVLLTGLGLWAAARVAGWRRPQSPPGLALPALLWLIVLTISSLLAPDHRADALKYTARTATGLLAGWAVYDIVVSSHQGRRRRGVLLRFLAIAGVAVTLLGLAELVQWEPALRWLAGFKKAPTRWAICCGSAPPWAMPRSQPWCSS